MVLTSSNDLGDSFRIKYRCMHIKCIMNVILFFSLGDLGVTYLPQDPRFTGSDPSEVNGFFQDVKILSTTPSSGTLSHES